MKSQMIWNLKWHEISPDMKSQKTWNLKWHEMSKGTKYQISWNVKCHEMSNVMKCWSWCWIYDPKQKRQALHTSERTIVPRTVIFFNIPTSYIDLLYFDNLLLKTPDLCNLRTFVAIFFVAIYALFPPIFGGKKTDSANLSAFRMYER